jgi:hypothetical protein
MKSFIISFFLLSALMAQGQSVLEHKLDGSEKGKTLQSYLEELEKKESVNFFFLPDWINGIVIEKDYAGQTLQYLLKDLFLGSDLNYLEFDRYTIVLVKDPTQAIQHTTLLNTAVRDQKKIEETQFGKPELSMRNKKVWVRGSVIYPVAPLRMFRVIFKCRFRQENILLL